MTLPRLSPVLLAFLVPAACTPAPRPAAAGGYAVDPDWPRKPAGLVWSDVPGVAVDRQDRVWIYTRRQPVVQVYAEDGAFLTAWEVGPQSAHYLKFDPEGNVWLADHGLHTVRKFSPEGKLLLTLGSPGEPGEDDRHFNQPTDMAITPAGDIFVTDGYGNPRVVHFDRNGKFVKAWGRKGKEPGEFDLPHAIVADSKGRLYVADRSNVRIQVFDPAGRFLAQWADILVPWCLTITSRDEIWTCGSTPPPPGTRTEMTGIPPHDQLIVKFDVSGKVLFRWSPPKGADGQEKPGETNWVHAVAPDSRGNLCAGDIRGRRVQKFVWKG